MSKDNFVKIVPVPNGWRFKEFYWERGHFWDECFASDVYQTVSSAYEAAQAYADENDLNLSLVVSEQRYTDLLTILESDASNRSIDITGNRRETIIEALHIAIAKGNA